MSASVQSRGLRYRSDRRTLAFVGVTLAMLLAPFAVALPWPIAAAWIALSSLLCFSCCVINHNHVHCPTFGSETLNSSLAVLLTLAKGHTSRTIVVPHLLNHHRHAGDEQDWIRTGLAGRGWGVARLLRYVLAASLTMARERRRPEAPVLPAVQQRSLRVEQAALLLFAATLLWLAPVRFALFVLVPWGFAIVALVAINLFQHDGCRAGSEFAGSRNFVGPLLNWFCFNNGFHTIHHLEPGLHWSLLPEAHRARVIPHMPPELDEPSLLAFVARNYVLGGDDSPSGRIDPAL